MNKANTGDVNRFLAIGIPKELEPHEFLRLAKKYANINTATLDSGDPIRQGIELIVGGYEAISMGQRASVRYCTACKDDKTPDTTGQCPDCGKFILF